MASCPEQHHEGIFQNAVGVRSITIFYFADISKIITSTIKKSN